jgi:hypothetical protein
MRAVIALTLIAALTAQAAGPGKAAPADLPRAEVADAGVAAPKLLPEELAVPLLPPLSDVPENGVVDADLTAAVAEAKATLDQGDAEAAKQSLISMLSSNDRFTHAQRTAVAVLAAPVLREVGKAEAAQGHLAEAAEAYDAAWVASGKRADPDYAGVLVSWAKSRRHENVREALWLARRARLADPNSAEAIDLDHTWSSNEWRYPGWVAIAVGLAGLVAGAVFWQTGWSAQKNIEGGGFQATAVLDRDLKTMHTNGIASTLSITIGTTLFVLGLAAIYFGQPVGPPMSPENLPALAEIK